MQVVVDNEYDNWRKKRVASEGEMRVGTIVERCPIEIRQVEFLRLM